MEEKASPNACRLLSEAVMRLMAKNKEDRYQSAAGVQADLEKCLRALDTPADDVVRYLRCC